MAENTKIPVPETPVHIIKSDGHTDNDHAPVSKVQNGQVRWFAHDDESATIDFNYTEGSPFSKPKFDVPARGSVPSGGVTSGVPGRHYRYTVHAPKGDYDPEVIIR